MATQILEIASVNLKDGVSPNDQRLLSVFRQCLDEISKAGGIHFRFIVSSPDNKSLEKPVAAMIGVWPTVELHSSFLSSGSLMPLLISLQDLITMREVVYLQIPEPTGEQARLMNAGKFLTVLFHVGTMEPDGFEETAKTVIEGKLEYVTGWNSTEGESFKQAEEFRRGRLEQDERDVEHRGVWGMILSRSDEATIEEINQKTGGKCEKIELLAWDPLNC